MTDVSQQVPSSASTEEQIPSAVAKSTAGNVSEEAVARDSTANPSGADSISQGGAPLDTGGDTNAVSGAQRIKIGSQREGDASAKVRTAQGEREADPTAQRAAPEPPRMSRLAAKVSSELSRESRKVPVPSARRELPPELQVELELAMGGRSLDELMKGAGESTPSEELAPETRLHGRVVSLHKENVFVDVGQPVQGVISLARFSQPPALGAEIEIQVVRYDGDEGLYELTLPGGAMEVGDWSQVAEGMVVEARVTGVNKGGLECEVNQLRGFIPASQAGLYRIDNLESVVGEKWNCLITSANREKRNLVLSRRAVLEREREAARQKLLAELAPGQIREGTVRNLQAFGAFIDLGGVDGLVHISEISWQRVSHPSEVLSAGQPVRVKIKKIDPETGKISLGLKELAESPWDHVAAKYPAKTTVTGKVSKIMEFGAFVELEPGVEGLVHISELDYKRVFRVSDVVSVGQEIEAQVLAVDAPQRRISLSMKALKSRPQPEAKPESEVEEEPLAPVERKRTRKLALKGGRDATAGGERFGLKW